MTEVWDEFEQLRAAAGTSSKRTLFEAVPAMASWSEPFDRSSSMSRSCEVLSGKGRGRS